MDRWVCTSTEYLFSRVYRSAYPNLCLLFLVITAYIQIFPCYFSLSQRISKFLPAISGYRSAHLNLCLLFLVGTYNEESCIFQIFTVATQCLWWYVSEKNRQTVQSFVAKFVRTHSKRKSFAAQADAGLLPRDRLGTVEICASLANPMHHPRMVDMGTTVLSRRNSHVKESCLMTCQIMLVVLKRENCSTLLMWMAFSGLIEWLLYFVKTILAILQMWHTRRLSICVYIPFQGCSWLLCGVC